MSLRTDLGRAELFDEQLLPFAAKLLQEKRYGDFALRCGTEVVTQEKRESSITAVFSASNLSTEQKNSIEAQFSGQATAAVWSAEVTSKFRSFVEEVSKTTRINVDVVTVGGPGAKDLSALFTDFGDLTQISAILRNYAAQLTFENAQSTTFISTRMSRYGWKGNSLDVSLTDMAMGDYYLLYRDADAIKQKAYSYINGTAPGAKGLTEDQVKDLRDTYTRVDQLARNVVATAKSCRQNEKLCAPASGFVIPDVKWPKVEPVGSVEQISKNVDCAQAQAPIAADVPYLCSQRSVFRVFARWDRVVGVEVADKWQQRYTPVHGQTETMAEAYARYKNQMGAAAADERKFLEMVTGERFASAAQATSRGWSSRPLTLNFLFGSSSSNAIGLRTSILFSFQDPDGVRSERIAFIY